MEHQDSAETVAPPTPGGPYEFTSKDNLLFKGLAVRMSSLGFFLLVLAALDMPALLRGEVESALVALLLAVTGTWSFFTANAVRNIVETEGSDISHLFVALKSLLHLLTIGVILVLVLMIVAGAEPLKTLFD